MWMQEGRIETLSSRLSAAELSGVEDSLKVCSMRHSPVCQLCFDSIVVSQRAYLDDQLAAAHRKIERLERALGLVSNLSLGEAGIQNRKALGNVASEWNTPSQEGHPGHHLPKLSLQLGDHHTNDGSTGGLASVVERDGSDSEDDEGDSVNSPEQQVIDDDSGHRDARVIVVKVEADSQDSTTAIMHSAWQQFVESSRQRAERLESLATKLLGQVQALSTQVSHEVRRH